MENGSGIRSQHIDRILRSDDVASLVQDSDDELQNEGMLLNCFGHMMYQFINFLKLDPENASLCQWPQECLRLENRRSQNSNSASGSTSAGEQKEGHGREKESGKSAVRKQW